MHEVAVVEEGQLVGVRDARPDLPTLLAAWPPAVLAGGRACGAAAADGSPDAALDSSSLGGEALGLGSASEEDVVSLWGVNICGPDDRVLCRQAGEQQGMSSGRAGGCGPRARCAVLTPHRLFTR